MICLPLAIPVLLTGAVFYPRTGRHVVRFFRVAGRIPRAIALVLALLPVIACLRVLGALRERRNRKALKWLAESTWTPDERRNMPRLLDADDRSPAR